jgi:hypothetical protein
MTREGHRMTPAFLAAVIDTLLPGDDVLPSGTGAGVTLAADAHAAVLEAISTQAGGMDAFAGALEPAHVAILRAVECAHPEAFRALLVAVLSDYGNRVGPHRKRMAFRSTAAADISCPSDKDDKVRARGRRGARVRSPFGHAEWMTIDGQFFEAAGGIAGILAAVVANPWWRMPSDHRQRRHLSRREYYGPYFSGGASSFDSTETPQNTNCA